MSMKTELPNAPDWLAAEMPPGYRNRLEEMERLARDLEAMGRFGRLLHAVGPELRDAVFDAFLTLEFDAAPERNDIVVSLAPTRRLLIHVSASERSIKRRDAELAQVFQMLHEQGGDGDRVILVANPDPATRPADRARGIEADALDLLERLGVNFLASPILFALWSLSLQDRAHARSYVERLHEQDGGVFAAPALLSV